jgi:hypothetical protein
MPDTLGYVADDEYRRGAYHCGRCFSHPTLP